MGARARGKGSARSRKSWRPSPGRRRPKRDPAPAPLSCWTPLGLGKGVLAISSVEALRDQRGPPPKVPISQGLRGVVRSMLGASESGEQSSIAPSERFPERRGDPGLAPPCTCGSRGEEVRGQTWQVSDEFTWRVTVPPP